ncbi:MAG: PadR family transcriptional regulator [Acidimicrobiales bacterium]
MRRKQGTALVRNEERILSAALALSRDGTTEFHGYRLVKAFEESGTAKLAMSTVYRCLSRLESRGMLAGEWRMDPDDPTVRPVRYFHLTPEGTEVAEGADEQYDIVGSKLRVRPVK